ncbi:MAG TPA: YggT family protein [Legionella sp.]|nr:YggT family protein [Legionella sp.]
MSGFTVVGFFLFSLIFGIIIFSLWLRIALRYFRVSSLNQFNRLIYTVTDPLVKPLSFIFKNHNKPGQRYDWAAFTVLLIVETLKIIVLGLVVFHIVIPFSYIILYVMADLIIQPCNILFYAILIRILISFANPGWQHPIADFLRLLTEPLLVWGRKIIPDISGFDFSPFIILIVLKVITLFISAYLPGNLL